MPPNRCPSPEIWSHEDSYFNSSSEPELLAATYPTVRHYAVRSFPRKVCALVTTLLAVGLPSPSAAAAASAFVRRPARAAASGFRADRRRRRGPRAFVGAPDPTVPARPLDRRRRRRGGGPRRLAPGDGTDAERADGSSGPGVGGSGEAGQPTVGGGAADSDALLDAAAAAFASSTSSSLVGVRSVGVDFGLVRTGVAATIGYDPRPLAILSDLNEAEVVDQVVRYCLSEGAGRVVVGLPLHKNGTESERSGMTRSFAEKLACAAYAHFGPDFPVHMWDERYSSKEAEARAMASDPKGTQLYGTLDADAACVILEHYYAAGAEGAEVVEVPDAMKGICEAAWQTKRAEEDRAKQEAKEKRREGLDARKLAMKRARVMEERMEKSGMLGTSRKKRKKAKKKRKKKPGGDKDWIVM